MIIQDDRTAEQKKTHRIGIVARRLILAALNAWIARNGKGAQ